MKRILIPLVIIAVVVIGALFIIKPQSSPAVAPLVPRAITPIPAVLETAAPTNEAKTVEMEAGSFYYKPDVLTVKVGQKVTIAFHSVSMMHNFNIDELNVHSDMVKNGDTATIEFTADKKGVFQYYCSVGKHRQLGQIGTITVE